jgi:hypothetical protein
MLPRWATYLRLEELARGVREARPGRDSLGFFLSSAGISRAEQPRHCQNGQTTCIRSRRSHDGQRKARDVSRAMEREGTARPSKSRLLTQCCASIIASGKQQGDRRPSGHSQCDAPALALVILLRPARIRACGNCLSPDAASFRHSDSRTRYNSPVRCAATHPTWAAPSPDLLAHVPVHATNLLA